MKKCNTLYLGAEGITTIKTHYNNVSVDDFQDAPEGEWTDVFEESTVPNRPKIPIYVDFTNQRWRGESYREYLNRTNDYHS